MKPAGRTADGGGGPDRTRRTHPDRRARDRAREPAGPAPRSTPHAARSAGSALDRERPAPAGATFCPTCATGDACKHCKQQAKTRTVSSPGDATERHADHVADAHTARAAAPDAASRKPHDAASLAPSASALRLPADLDAQITATRGRGTAIPDAVRATFEPTLGPLDDVRFHTDTGASRLASSLDARAFTVGRDVYFAAGSFRPDTPDGERLLAHELAHAVTHGADDRHVHRQSFGGTRCRGTEMLPGNPKRRGTYEHVLIQQYYTTVINPTAEAEYLIPKSGPRGGDSTADIVDPSAGGSTRSSRRTTSVRRGPSCVGPSTRPMSTATPSCHGTPAPSTGLLRYRSPLPRCL